jgi:hypothetical protein
MLLKQHSAIYNPKMLKKLTFEDKSFDFLHLIKEWEKIVGPLLAQNSYPLKMKQDSLVILTRHSVFSQELSFKGELIKQNIFEIFPELKSKIRTVSFQTNEAFFHSPLYAIKKPTPVHLPHPHNPVVKKATAEARVIFSGIENKEIADSFVSIFVQNELSKK